MQVFNKQTHYAAFGRAKQMKPMPLCLRTVAQRSHQHAHLPSRQSLVISAAKGFGVPLPKQQKQEKSVVPVVQDPCPCSSGKAYKNCCEKIHNGAKAKNAEAALRARFSAYVRGKEDFIKATTHHDYFDFHYMKPRAESAEQFEVDVGYACSQVEYSDFKMTQVEPGSNDLEAFVAFAYKHASKDKAAEQDAWSVTNQKCRFLKVGDVWQFVDYQTYNYNMAQLAQDVRPEESVKPAAAAS